MWLQRSAAMAAMGIRHMPLGSRSRGTASLCLCMSTFPTSCYPLLVLPVLPSLYIPSGILPMHAVGGCPKRQALHALEQPLDGQRRMDSAFAHPVSPPR